MPALIADTLAQWPAPVWAGIFAAVVFSAVAHGAIGFGFPLLSTPLIAMIVDVRTAVLYTLLPNIVLNVISVLRGGGWWATVRRHGRVAVFVLLGAVLGTQVLAIANANALKLLLAALIAAYLLQARWAAGLGARVRAHEGAAGLAFGLLGGFFSGAVNVAVPPLLMFFGALELGPVAMTQALNLCFLVGRGTQIGALAWAGSMAPSVFLVSLVIGVLAVSSLKLGFSFQRRLSPAIFARLLRATLWTMTAVLVLQGARGLT